jgi:hypothetical protein
MVYYIKTSNELEIFKLNLSQNDNGRFLGLKKMVVSITATGSRSPRFVFDLKRLTW